MLATVQFGTFVFLISKRFEMKIYRDVTLSFFNKGVKLGLSC